MQINEYTKRRTAAIAATVLATTTTIAVVHQAFQSGVALSISPVMAGVTGVATFVVSSIVWVHFSPDYDPADIIKVSVDEAIRREQNGGPMSDDADAASIVESIEDADENPYADTLLIEVNTPGGEIVPSEDIRRAVRDFDGPTAAIATDQCASGGYLVASACDHIVAREGAMVGSIGVLGSQVNFSGLADELGVEYERYTAGEYKDAGTPLKEPDEGDREHIQNLIDTHYDTFVRRVAEGRPLSEDEIRDTEARVYLGPDAKDAGLIDEVGDEETAREYLSEQIETEAESAAILQYEPEPSGSLAVAQQAHEAAYSLGAGIADQFTARVDVDGWIRSFKLR